MIHLEVTWEKRKTQKTRTRSTWNAVLTCFYAGGKFSTLIPQRGFVSPWFLASLNVKRQVLPTLLPIFEGFCCLWATSARTVKAT